MDFVSKSYKFNEINGTVIIAEVGVNHNGSIDLAKKMVDKAVECGVDIVKFQAFKSEKEISRYAVKTPYQEATTSEDENQLEMCKALELSGDALVEIKKYCEDRKVPFLCTAFDFDSVDLLVDTLKVDTIKIPSGEVTNIPFLEYIGSKKKSVILSTGASSLGEVANALDALNKSGCPELVLFHCVSEYPAPACDVNLRAMSTMRNAFSVPVGFSDHTLGNSIAFAAAALGAVAIEKHFTLDKNMSGPDHRASIEPDELSSLVQGVKAVNAALGNGVKKIAHCEIHNVNLIRKSLVASRNLFSGTVITRDMIEIKRPEGGIHPVDIEKLIGLTLKKDVPEDMHIRWEDLYD